VIIKKGINYNAGIDNGGGGAGNDKLIFNSPEEAVKALESKGYVVRTVDQENEYISNRLKDEIGNKVKEIHSRYDQDIKELTGYEKQDNEKTYDLLKRAVGELSNEKKSLAEKLEQLKKEGMSGNKAAEEIQAQFEASKNNWTKERQELEAKLKTVEQKQFNYRFENEIGGALNKIIPTLKSPEAIGGKAVFDRAVKAAIDEFKSQYKVDLSESGFVYHDKDGKPVMNSKTHTPKTTEELLSESLKFLVDEQRRQTGAGASAGQAVGGSANDQLAEYTINQQFRSRVELTNYLIRERKLDQNSAEFAKFYQANSKTPDGNPLPLK
jgi:membrane-associated HD superfamily phosphohydrolase